jgi:hypothetical protein
LPTSRVPDHPAKRLADLLELASGKPGGTDLFGRPSPPFTGPHRRLTQLRPGGAGNKPAASMLGVLHTTLANPCPAAFAAGLFRVSRLDSGHDGRTLMGRRPMSTYLRPGASFAGRLLLSRSRPARASGKCRKSDLYLCSTNRACPSGELLTCVSTFAPGPVPLPGAFLFRASFCCAPEWSFVAASGIMPPPQGFEILPIVTSCLACLGRVAASPMMFKAPVDWNVISECPDQRFHRDPPADQAYAMRNCRQNVEMPLMSMRIETSQINWQKSICQAPNKSPCG